MRRKLPRSSIPSSFLKYLIHASIAIKVDRQGKVYGTQSRVRLVRFPVSALVVVIENLSLDERAFHIKQVLCKHTPEVPFLWFFLERFTRAFFLKPVNQYL